MKSTRRQKEVDRDPAPGHATKGRSSITPVVVAAGCVVAFDAYASFFPGAGNWSAHHLSFFSPVFRVCVIVLMALVLIPRVRLSLVSGLDFIARRFSSLRLFPRRIIYIVLLLAGIAAFWVARERLLFLGDGYLVVRNLGQTHTAAIIPNMSFRDAPAAALFSRELSELLGGFGHASADEFAFRYISVVAGVAWMFLALWMSRLLVTTPLDRLLVVLVIMSWGGIQLFFGYVEVYPLAATALLFFLTSSLAHVRRGLPFYVPSLAFGFLATTHFGMFFLLPAYLWLSYTNVRSRKYGRIIGGWLVATGTFVVLLAMSEYTPARFFRLLSLGAGHGVPWFEAVPGKHAYTMFSIHHGTEMLNLLLLTVPASLAAFAAILLANKSSVRWRDHEWTFLAIAVVSACGFLFLMNPDLGMSRDWDIFSLFTIPIVVIALFSIGAHISSLADRRHVLCIISVLGILHVFPWIAVNASTDRALARFSLLNDGRYWGRTAVLGSYDELAAYYRTVDNLPRVREYYEKYVAVDSTNGRILGNCGSVCIDMHDDSSAIGYLERAIRYNTIVYTAYVDLAKLYASRNRYAEAVEVSQRGLARGFVSADVLNSHGVFLIKATGKYDEALVYFEMAIKKDSLYDQSYLNAGVSCSFLKRYEEMEKYFLKFLSVRPDYENAQQLHDAIARARQK